MLTADDRESKLFGITIVMENLKLMERLFLVTNNNKLIEPIDELYQFIEKYEIDR